MEIFKQTKKTESDFCEKFSLKETFAGSFFTSPKVQKQ